MIKILLLIDYSSDYDRRLLRGLVRYSEENGPWMFYRLPFYFIEMYGMEGVLDWARRWNPDAIIGKLESNTIDLQKELNVPVVLLNFHWRSTIYSNLTGDYREEGRIAAAFFRDKFFRDFAFFGFRDVIWSEERRDGFEEEVRRCGGQFHSFMTLNVDDDMRAGLAQWLRQLPKPVALFCCDDERALFVSETCKMFNISIPEEISLLGVDNDELMCSISDPPISSIPLLVEEGGYAMAKLLEQQIAGKDNNAFNLKVMPGEIIERRSTDRYNIRDASILKVVKYINENYTTELDTGKLLKLVPLSRRNLETKFHRTMGISIYQYILDRRCDRLAHLLADTSMELAEAAHEAGFSSYSNLSRIFKKRKGLTPSEYRAASQKRLHHVSTTSV